MLSGPLVKNILIFALPLAVTGILQQLFNAADVAVVGRFVGKNAMEDRRRGNQKPHCPVLYGRYLPVRMDGTLPL